MIHTFKSFPSIQSNSERTIAYHLNFLIPQRISIARELRGLTKKALAISLGISSSAITQFESGDSKPSSSTFINLANLLKLPYSFFSSEIISSEHPAIEEYHYRARASITQMMKYKSRRYAEIVISIFKFLENFGVQFPNEGITNIQNNLLDGMTVSEAAEIARKSWGLSELPILDLFPLLENNGVFIILLDQEFDALEGCATWFGTRPCIMLAQDKLSKSSSRVHFDLAHELGHLILHDESFMETEKELQAHEFASSFLLPQSTYTSDSPKRWDLNLFLDVKNKWHISIQAALRRSRDLGIITDSSYRWGMIDLSRKGYRVTEPGEFPLGHPSLLAKAIDLVKSEISLEELAESVSLHPDELKDILIKQAVPSSLLHSMKKSKPTETPILLQFKKDSD